MHVCLVCLARMIGPLALCHSESSCYKNNIGKSEHFTVVFRLTASDKFSNLQHGCISVSLSGHSVYQMQWCHLSLFNCCLKLLVKSAFEFITVLLMGYILTQQPFFISRLANEIFQQKIVISELMCKQLCCNLNLLLSS